MHFNSSLQHLWDRTEGKTEGTLDLPSFSATLPDDGKVEGRGEVLTHPFFVPIAQGEGREEGREEPSPLVPPLQFLPAHEGIEGGMGEPLPFTPPLQPLRRRTE